MEKKLKSKIKDSEEDLYPQSAEILMSEGFILILLNMLIGFLPVTISGSKIRHCWCSLTTIGSIIAVISMILLSVVFGPISVFLYLGFGFTEVSTTNIVAIGILKASHLVGYLCLLFNSHWVAKEFPRIWRSLVTAFHFSVVTNCHLQWKRLKVLRRSSRLSGFIYILIILVYQYMQSSNVMVDMIRYFDSSEYGPFVHPSEATIVGVGYVIWDLESLSHVFVSMLLTYLVLVTTLCLKCSNKLLQEIVEESNAISVSKTDKDVWFVAKVEMEESGSDYGVHAKLESIKKVYAASQDVMSSLSKAGGVFIIVETLVLLGNTLGNGYFILSNLLYSKSTRQVDFMSLFASFLIHFYFLFRLACATTNMINETEKPQRILQELNYGNVKFWDRYKISEFKADMMSYKIRLSAKDYFQVNKFLITSLVGSITTYLIVLLQFKAQDGCGFGPSDDHEIISSSTPQYELNQTSSSPADMII